MPKQCLNKYNMPSGRQPGPSPGRGSRAGPCAAFAAWYFVLILCIFAHIVYIWIKGKLKRGTSKSLDLPFWDLPFWDLPFWGCPSTAA